MRLRIVLEMMEGGALDTLLYTETERRARWRPSPDQVLKMAADVAKAMGYLHGPPKGFEGAVIHRDLKSPNLLLEAFPPGAAPRPPPRLPPQTSSEPLCLPPCLLSCLRYDTAGSTYSRTLVLRPDSRDGP